MQRVKVVKLCRITRVKLYRIAHARTMIVRDGNHDHKRLQEMAIMDFNKYEQSHDGQGESEPSLDPKWK